MKYAMEELSSLSYSLHAVYTTYQYREELVMMLSFLQDLELQYLYTVIHDYSHWTASIIFVIME